MSRPPSRMSKVSTPSNPNIIYIPPDPNEIHWGPPLATNPARLKKYKAQIDQWLKDPYTLPPAWMERARVELGEDPKKLRTEVQTLRQLIKQDTSLHSREDDHFLLAFLRSKRHDMESAHRAIQKYYRMKKLNPESFELCLPSQRPKLYELKALNLLNGFDVNHRPIVYIQAAFPPSAITNREFIQIMIHLLEFIIIDPRIQISGLTILADFAAQTMGHTKMITVKFLKLMLQIFQIHVMGNDIKSVAETIPLSVLPTELEGEAVYRQEMLAERLNMVENYFREWGKFGYVNDPGTAEDDDDVKIHGEET